MKLTKKEAIEPRSRWPILAEASSHIFLESLKAVCIRIPELIPIFATAQAMIVAYKDFGQARVNELVKDIRMHEEKLDRDFIKTEEFKSVFLNVLQKHFTESAERKRQLLRNYLFNVGSGKYKNFDYHTKILFVMDQITFDELRVISIWKGQLQKKIIEKNKKIGVNRSNVDKHIKDLNVTQVMFAFEGQRNKFTEDQLEFILKSLGNYGLLDIREFTGAAWGGGTYGIVVRGITDFGKKFLQFLEE